MNFDKYNRMNSFIALVKRNMVALIKNKAIFGIFTIGMIAMISLFFLYVRKSEIIYLIDIATFNGFYISKINAEIIIDNWFVGNITIASMLFTASAITLLYHSDKSDSIRCDLSTMPLRCGSIDLAYIIGGSIVVLIVGILSLSTGLIVLAKTHKLFMRSADIAGAIVTLPLSAITITAFIHLIGKIFRKLNSFLIICIALLILIAYISGLIVPIDKFPLGLIKIFNILPSSQSAILLKHYLLEYTYYEFSANIPYFYKIMIVNRLTFNNLHAYTEFKWEYNLYIVLAYSIILPLFSLGLGVLTGSVKRYLLKRRNLKLNK